MNLFLKRTTLAVIAVSFMPVFAFAQTHDELIKELNALAEKVTKDVTADTKLEAALGKFETAVDALLKRTDADDKKMLDAVTARLAANLENDAISGEVAKLRAVVLAYEAQQHKTFVVMLAEELTAALKKDEALDSATLTKVQALSDQIADVEVKSQKEAIIARAVTLLSMINANGPIKEADVRPTELDLLLAGLRTIEAKRFHEAVTNRVASLNMMLEPEVEPKKVLSREHFTALNSLKGKIENILGDGPATDEARKHEAIVAKATELEMLIKSFSPINDADERPQELTDLLALLREIEAKRFHVAVGATIDSLKTMLKPEAEVRNALSKSHFTALNELKGLIVTVLGNGPELKSGVHVLGASFGRVAGDRTPGDTCNARATVMKSCQGEAECSLTKEAFGKVCGGYDPAPFKSGWEKGLFVRYVCLVNQPLSIWNSYLSTGSSSYGGKVRTAVLRSENDAFTCVQN